MNFANFTAFELVLKSNTDVLGYIREKNAARDAEAKSEGWTFWTSISESLAEKFDNVYDLEHMLACGSYSDFHKEVYGMRPSAGYSKLTLVEIEAAIDELSEESV